MHFINALAQALFNVTLTILAKRPGLPRLDWFYCPSQKTCNSGKPKCLEFIFLEQKVQAEYSFEVPFNNLNTINIKYNY